MNESEFDQAYAATQLARRQSPMRSRIKQFYLQRILRHAIGPTLDIGCGAGQLLEQLPAGSKGIEVNPVLVAQLRRQRLDVEQVFPSTGSISVGTSEPGRFRTAVLSHVLEHFDNASAVLEALIVDCRRLGIERLIVVVPGALGYRSDATHKTFVTDDYLRQAGLLDRQRFRAVGYSYFPGNLKFLGHLFIYHEMMVVYDLK